jgi:hypothetical protein
MQRAWPEYNAVADHPVGILGAVNPKLLGSENLFVHNYVYKTPVYPCCVGWALNSHRYQSVGEILTELREPSINILRT